ncbi:cohesin domain-containing protein [Candidatus Parcubacteria bacterium]|nr:cohesin domain-containing protein [Candidatus Parcubacteria bacterium]
MRKLFIIVQSLTLIFILLFSFPLAIFAQQVIQANPINQKATVFITPRSGTFLEGSTFEVPIFLNTHNNSINALQLEVKFDPKKLSIVKPSGGQSIIGIWVEPPSFSNTQGFVRIVGAIPNSITTESGLITTITFKAIASGPTTIFISKTTKVLASDGFGSEVPTSLDQAVYTIMRRPPEDVKVFSETHPFTDQWYNNDSPIVSWEKNPQVTDFSFTYDNKPFTIPDNIPDTEETTISFPDSAEGISYFHIKSRKKDVWGATTHFPIRIDTTAPAGFTPHVESLQTKTDEESSRAIVSFFTTDNLSGIDHYEIGIIDQSTPADVSPAFVQSESPFLLPVNTEHGSRLIVRAFDRAGNVRDVSMNVSVPFALTTAIRSNVVWILALLLIIILILLLIHYLIGHKILANFKKALKIIHDEERQPFAIVPRLQPQGVSEHFEPQFQQKAMPQHIQVPEIQIPVVRLPEDHIYTPNADSALNR